MKILYKLNLMSLAIIVILTGLILSAGGFIIKGILYNYGDKVLQLELFGARDNIINRLNQSGMVAARKEAAGIQAVLNQKREMRTALLWVVEKQDKRTIYSSNFQTGEKLPFDFIDDMFKKESGSMEYKYNSVNYHSVFITVQPENWLMVLSIDRDDMLSYGKDFLFATVGILFIVLCINAIAVRFFAKHIFLKRIKMVLDCLKRIEKGDLSARISPISVMDEVGTLQEGVNKMAAGIHDRALQQQEAEEALRKSSQMLTCVMENFPGVVFWKDRESIYLGCNRNFALGAGLTDPSEIVGKTDYDLPWAKTEADSYRADDRFVMDTGAPKLDIIETQLQADGSIIWFDTNKVPLFDNNGNVTGVLGTSNDITQRKRAEEELNKSAEEIHDLFNRAPVGYHSLDKNGMFVRINDTELQWLGYQREEVISRLTFADILTPESKKVFEEYFPVFIKQGRIRDVELEIIRKNGETLPALISATAVTGPDGEFVMSRSTVYDISERKNAEQALREVQEELVRKEKLAILGQLAGIVGHEIRNPLGVMTNAVYFLKTLMPEANDTTKEYLEIIDHEIKKSLRIITDLLDFARTRPPYSRSISASSLIDQGVRKSNIPENILIDIDIPAALPPVFVDPEQVEAVLHNLITNAVQAMPEGGALNISAEVRGQRSEVGDQKSEIRDQRSEVRGAPDSNFVKIVISDTGVGISPENMKKLFQPLFTTKAKGIGLGLVVCKNLVEANGGRITAESVLGKGTTFIIMLPIKGEINE